MDQSKSRKYQELPNAHEVNSEVSKQDKKVVDLEHNVTHIFDEPHGFTAMIVIDEVSKDLIWKVLSDPEAYMHLSPNIVCVTFEDDSKTDRGRNIHLDLTLTRKWWWFWERAETVDGYFVVDSENGEISLRKTISSNESKVEVISFYQIDSFGGQGGGTQVVVNVSVDKPLLDSCGSFRRCFPCWISAMNALKQEHSRLLLNLRDHVQTASSLETYRHQKSEEYLLSATI